MGWFLVRIYLIRSLYVLNYGMVMLSPKNTSNLCSRCQRLTPSKIGDDFSCACCGHTMDRDHNAAMNILGRGVVIPGGRGGLAATSVKCRLMNFKLTHYP